MNHQLCDALTRRAALSALSAAALATMARSAAAGNAQRRNTKGKKGNGDRLKLCKKQVGQCSAFFTTRCGGDPDCLAVVARCCPSFGNCDPPGFFAYLSQQ